MLFSYGNIYLLYMYIFFLQVSQSIASPTGQEREHLCKGLASSLSCRVDQVCSCCSWVLVEGKKMLLKNMT